MYSFYKVHPKCELHRIEILTTKSSDPLALTILTSIAHHHSLETEDHPVKARKSTRTSVCIHPACARNQVTVKNPPLSPSSFALSISLSLSLSRTVRCPFIPYDRVHGTVGWRSAFTAIV